MAVDVGNHRVRTDVDSKETLATTGSPGHSETSGTQDTLCQPELSGSADNSGVSLDASSRIELQRDVAVVPGMYRRPKLNPRSLPLLLDLRARIIRDGWGRTDDATRWSLLDVRDGSLEAWHALELLRWFSDHNLPKWNDAPGRTGSDVVALIDKAILEFGARPPRTRYREPRRRGGRAGGWTISDSPARQRASRAGSGPEPGDVSLTSVVSGRAFSLPFARRSPHTMQYEKPLHAQLVEVEATTHAAKEHLRQIARAYQIRNKELGRDAEDLVLELSTVLLAINRLRVFAELEASAVSTLENGGRS